jgi:anthranilate synthase component 2
VLLVIDNYDSFTWNLVQILRELGGELLVVRNDEASTAELLARRPQRIVISPGPCTPREAGVSVPLVREAIARGIPLLGVCLGHQSLGAALGARVVRARAPMHGKTSLVRHDGSGVFAGLPSPYRAMRYHSLVVERASLPAELLVNAWTEEGEIMGLRHAHAPVHGVQFHPESFLSEHGHALLASFLDLPDSPGIRACTATSPELPSPPPTAG